MANQKVFPIPWGSESICYWCTKNGKCKLWTEDPEIPTMTLPTASNMPTVEVVKSAGVRMRFTQMFKLGSLQGCPINEFNPDPTRLPEQFKDCKIVVR
jgi:hypothetical protein